MTTETHEAGCCRTLYRSMNEGITEALPCSECGLATVGRNGNGVAWCPECAIAGGGAWAAVVADECGYDQDEVRIIQGASR